MKEKLIEIVKSALETNGISTDNREIIIEKTKDHHHGDFATNIAMQLARELKKNPREIAEQLIHSISDDAICKIEVAGPGFINFFLAKDYLFENINLVLKEKENYGRVNVGNQVPIIIEYVSANPTGFLHIGHARGAAYGDGLARIKSFAGYQVTREYYINDAGNQMNNLGISIKARYYELFDLPMEIPEGGYMGKEIKEIALKLKDEYGNTKLEESTEFFKQYGLKILLKKIELDLEKFHVGFDCWTSEQFLYDSGRVENVLNQLKESGYTYEEDGALWLKTKDYDEKKNRVLIKNDGLYTYYLPDIAEHLYKIERGNKKLIDVFGADHHGYINRLKAALEIFGYSRDLLDVKIGQMVRMVKEGKEVKMSKRTGNAYTLNDLMQEVGVDAARYFFAAKSLDTQMDFDLDLATKKSNDNPVYYIQYAYARISSILREYNKEVHIEKYETIQSEYAMDLLAKVYAFPEIVTNAALKEAPHMIANYAYELATLFHAYYAHEKVLTEDEKQREERINMITAVQWTLKNALNLIGVSAKEEM